MSFWDGLDPKYSVILCDIWGVVHDGVSLYPNAVERLRQWRQQGRKIILITNAPRTADAVEAQLGRIGLPSDCWDGIATSGEAGIAAIKALGHPTGFLGTDQDRINLENHGMTFDDEHHVWNLETADGDTISTRFVVGATGVLTKPKPPNITWSAIARTVRWVDATISLWRRIGFLVAE